MPSNRAHLFNKSPYYDKQVLAMALMGTKYQDADIDYYHEKADIWSNKGKGNKKIDWLATLKNWMCEALREGKLVYKVQAELDKQVEETADRITGAFTKWQTDEVVESQPKPIEKDLGNWQPQWEERKADALIIPIDKMIISGPLVEWVWQNEPDLDRSPDTWAKYMITAKDIYERHLQEENTPQSRDSYRELQKEGWEKDVFLLQAVERRAKVVAIKKLLYIYKEQSAF